MERNISLILSELTESCKNRHVASMQNIIKKYEQIEQQDDEDDLVDLENMQIIEDRGVLRSFNRMKSLKSIQNKTNEEKDKLEYIETNIKRRNVVTERTQECFQKCRLTKENNSLTKDSDGEENFRNIASAESSKSFTIQEDLTSDSDDMSTSSEPVCDSNDSESLDINNRHSSTDDYKRKIFNSSALSKCDFATFIQKQEPPRINRNDNYDLQFRKVLCSELLCYGKFAHLFKTTPCNSGKILLDDNNISAISNKTDAENISLNKLKGKRYTYKSYQISESCNSKDLHVSNGHSSTDDYKRKIFNSSALSKCDFATFVQKQEPPQINRNDNYDLQFHKVLCSELLCYGKFAHLFKTTPCNSGKILLDNNISAISNKTDAENISLNKLKDKKYTYKSYQISESCNSKDLHVSNGHSSTDDYRWNIVNSSALSKDDFTTFIQKQKTPLFNRNDNYDLQFHKVLCSELLCYGKSAHLFKTTPCNSTEQLVDNNNVSSVNNETTKGKILMKELRVLVERYNGDSQFSKLENSCLSHNKYVSSDKRILKYKIVQDSNTQKKVKESVRKKEDADPSQDSSLLLRRSLRLAIQHDETTLRRSPRIKGTPIVHYNNDCNYCNKQRSIKTSLENKYKKLVDQEISLSSLRYNPRQKIKDKQMTLRKNCRVNFMRSLLTSNTPQNFKRPLTPIYKKNFYNKQIIDCATKNNGKSCTSEKVLLSILGPNTMQQNSNKQMKLRLEQLRKKLYW